MTFYLLEKPALVADAAHAGAPRRVDTHAYFDGQRVPPEMLYFLLLSAEEQAAAIRRLAFSGMSIGVIAAATRLSVEQVRQIIGPWPALRAER